MVTAIEIGNLIKDYGSFITTIALVIVTLAYVFLTKRLVDANERIAKSQNKPILSLDLKNSLSLVIRNIGNIPAQKITLKIDMFNGTKNIGEYYLSFSLPGDGDFIELKDDIFGILGKDIIRKDTNIIREPNPFGEDIEHPMERWWLLKKRIDFNIFVDVSYKFLDEMHKMRNEFTIEMISEVDQEEERKMYELVEENFQVIVHSQKGGWIKRWNDFVDRI